MGKVGSRRNKVLNKNRPVLPLVKLGGFMLNYIYVMGI